MQLSLGLHGLTFYRVPQLQQSFLSVLSTTVITNSVSVISVPGRTKRLLVTSIPHYEMCIINHYFFYIASYCKGCMYNFIHRKLVKDGSSLCITQSNNGKYVLLVVEQSPYPGEENTRS